MFSMYQFLSENSLMPVNLQMLILDCFITVVYWKNSRKKLSCKSRKDIYFLASTTIFLQALIKF